MNFRASRVRLAAGTVSALATCALAVSVSPASADVSRDVVHGAGAYSNDWSDEGTLSRTSYAKSNAACLWQTILWAEGATEQDGTAYDSSDIDGAFGANTEHATKKLQSRWGLRADGKVGNDTFGKADSKLRYSSGSTESGKYLYLKYAGAEHTFSLTRTGAGQYLVYENGKWRYTTYSTRTCS